MNTNKTFLLDYAPRSFALRLIWEWFTDPIGFVMTRKMLLGIQAAGRGFARSQVVTKPVAHGAKCPARCYNRGNGGVAAFP